MLSKYARTIIILIATLHTPFLHAGNEKNGFHDKQQSKHTPGSQINTSENPEDFRKAEEIARNLSKQLREIEETQAELDKSEKRGRALNKLQRILSNHGQSNLNINGSSVVVNWSSKAILFPSIAMANNWVIYELSNVLGNYKQNIQNNFKNLLSTTSDVMTKGHEYRHLNGTQIAIASAWQAANQMKTNRNDPDSSSAGLDLMLLMAIKSGYFGYLEREMGDDYKVIFP